MITVYALETMFAYVSSVTPETIATRQHALAPIIALIMELVLMMTHAHVKQIGMVTFVISPYARCLTIVPRMAFALM